MRYLLPILMASAFAGPCCVAQGTIPRRESLPIDWSAAQADVNNTEATQSQFLTTLRAAVPTGINDVHLPVLVPALGPIRAAPRFRGQGSAYAAAYLLNAARLSVLGSNLALVMPEPKVRSTGTLPETANPRHFEMGEDGSDLSFVKYGASYTLRITCTLLTDSRCTQPAFLNSVADTLVPVGGQP